MEKVTPEYVRTYMQKNGTDITMEQAAQILEFLTLLARVCISGYLVKENPMVNNRKAL